MCAPSCALLLCYCPRARTLLSLCEHVHRALRRELRYLSLSARFPLQKTSQRPFKQVKPPSNEEIKKLRFVSSMLTWVLTPDITQKSRETKIEKRRKKAVERETVTRKRVIAAVNMRRADVRSGEPPTKFDGTSFAGSFPRLTRALHGVCLVRVGDRSRV